MVGASARYARLRTPVETSTSPYGAYVFCGKRGFASLTMRLQRGTSPPLGIPLASGGVERQGPEGLGIGLWVEFVLL